MAGGSLNTELAALASSMEGDLLLDYPSRLMYATDASVYREIPMAVSRPLDVQDLRLLIRFASDHGLTLIPRGAGTSLAGQVVGAGLVVDVSRYMNKILEFNLKERWVSVEPGVVLDELNLFLEPYGLFFGPETSTSNRCMMGGMVGNNSSGAHSLIYGTTRDHLLEVKVLLSDGKDVVFKALNEEEYRDKLQGDSLENKLYRQIDEILTDPETREHIIEEFPDPEVKRRNTGYALDVLAQMKPFAKGKEARPFNFSKLIAGSEGTLAFITRVKLNLVPLPSPEKSIICVHVNSVMEAIRGNLIALKFKPGAVELMDKTILDCTKENIEQKKNRFFIKGDPIAILIVEFDRETPEQLDEIHRSLENEMRKEGIGYHFPMLKGGDIQKVWSLRKAGLGVLSNIPGDAKPVAVIEDTSVNVERLESFITEFNILLDSYQLECVYYAHISVGELHLRPVLNLKDPKDVKIFRSIAEDVVHLTKKYKGSLSGEHGDGRLRGEFIRIITGEANYEIMRQIKQKWDPGTIFNAGKITDTPPMDSSLRYIPGKETPEIRTWFDFSDSGGFLRMAEKCNGSGDCRKSSLMGGTMCPSFMASRDENKTTRARANVLREYLSYSSKQNPFDHPEIYDILDLCLACKGCKSECPSNVDMAKMKAEFLQHYHDTHGIPLRTKAIAYIARIQKLGSLFPWLYNYFLTNKTVSGLVKKMLGFAGARSMPRLYRQTLRKWIRQNLDAFNEEIEESRGRIFFFVDEFTNFNDTAIGIKAIRLLQKLGYRVSTLANAESARAFLSKGLLRKAKTIAEKNILLYRGIIGEEVPLVGLEPSAILGFRDEYPDLVDRGLVEDAREIAKHAFTLEEFLDMEMQAGRIGRDLFTAEEKQIKLHGHCQQKAVASTAPTLRILSWPSGYTAEEIPSGCCGMAGSFGYEKEHYDLSMKVGELVLFPEIRASGEEIVIVAAGTSCRHQIKDGTGRTALHPAEILHEALV